jgi:acetyltransferase
MATYPAELTRHRRLADGREITIRAIRAEDAGMEQEFVRHLSDDARYKRFMGAVNELPEDELRYLTDIDYETHMALIATVPGANGEVEIGVARYVTDAAMTSCEFAIVVDDAWQGTGVAGLLMQTLIRTARLRGLQRMEGLVLANNHRMLHFTRQLGFEPQREPDDPGTIRVVRSLQSD